MDVSMCIPSSAPLYPAPSRHLHSSTDCSEPTTQVRCRAAAGPPGTTGHSTAKTAGSAARGIFRYLKLHACFIRQPDLGDGRHELYSACSVGRGPGDTGLAD